MRPYLLEGLDCSGKKTVARAVRRAMRERGRKVDLVIGPLWGGPWRALDKRLVNITQAASRGSTLDRFRRAVYTLEPTVDRLHYTARAVLKISSHYRAWARAEIEDDWWMMRALASTARLHVRYAGATLLHTDFWVRLERHAADAKAGRTTKPAQLRFLGPDEGQFAHWHSALSELLIHHVEDVQHLDSTCADVGQVAEAVVDHAMSCWPGQR